MGNCNIKKYSVLLHLLRHVRRAQNFTWRLQPMKEICASKSYRTFVKAYSFLPLTDER